MGRLKEMMAEHDFYADGGRKVTCPKCGNSVFYHPDKPGFRSHDDVNCNNCGTKVATT